MRVLVVGKGGRESAIVWKISQSRLKAEIFAAPGNPYTARFGRNVNIPEKEIESIVRFAKENGINADACEREGIRTFAPMSHLAKLEGSKIWTNYEHFGKEEIEDAIRFCEGARYPLAIKADGLTGGKGLEEFMIKGKFGKSSERVVIEKFLRGEEVSIFVIADGKKWEKLGYVRDFKRLYDKDKGPNTGGMGSVAPILLDRETEEMIDESIIKRTFEGLWKEYFGIMITNDGPFVLEYNVRLGDPEAQALLPLIEGDFLEACLYASEGSYNLGSLRCNHKNYSCCVVIAERGYPENPESGKEVSGIEEAEEISKVEAKRACIIGGI